MTWLRKPATLMTLGLMHENINLQLWPYSCNSCNLFKKWGQRCVPRVGGQRGHCNEMLAQLNRKDSNMLCQLAVKAISFKEAKKFFEISNPKFWFQNKNWFKRFKQIEVRFTRLISPDLWTAIISVCFVLEWQGSHDARTYYDTLGESLR